jgi:hypothetical protein
VNIFEALEAAPAAPCGAYSCPKRNDCSEQKLACESFLYYVNTGRSVHPLMIFKSHKQGWKVTNILKKTHDPSRDLFNRFNAKEVKA